MSCVVTYALYLCLCPVSFVLLNKNAMWLIVNCLLINKKKVNTFTATDSYVFL